MNIHSVLLDKRTLVLSVTAALLVLSAVTLMGFGRAGSAHIDFGECAVTVQRIDPVEEGQKESKVYAPVCYQSMSDYVEANPAHAELVTGTALVQDAASRSSRSSTTIIRD